MDKRRLEEKFFKLLMLASIFIIVSSLLAVIGVVLLRGLPALNLAMITQTPIGGYYLGKEGGVLNAIIGSIYLAFGAIGIALPISLGVAFYLQREYSNSKIASLARLSLDILWGIPSIVYGAFGFTIMLLLGMRASLLAGIITLALLELPILTRSMDEVLIMIPVELKEASYGLGATRLETSIRVIAKQALPGFLTGVLLAFGRGIGDAASILFTAGYTDHIPSSLFDPAASLPLAVFFQLGTPIPEVQERAYASAVILLAIVLSLSLISRLLTKRFTKFTIK